MPTRCRAPSSTCARSCRRSMRCAPCPPATRSAAATIRGSWKRACRSAIASSSTASPPTSAPCTACCCRACCCARSATCARRSTIPDYVFEALKVYLLLGQRETLYREDEATTEEDKALVHAWLDLDWQRQYSEAERARLHDHLAALLEMEPETEARAIALDGNLVQSRPRDPDQPAAQPARLSAVQRKRHDRGAAGLARRRACRPQRRDLPPPLGRAARPGDSRSVHL